MSGRAYAEGEAGPRLDAREAAFCDEYLIDLDARAAALRAGYPLSLARHAADWLAPGATRYRRRLEEGVAARLAARSRRTGVSADRVLREYARIAFASIGDICDFEGGARIREGLTPEELAAVASLKVKPGSGECEVKMYDKMKALETLARHLGMAEAAGDGAEMPRIVACADGSATIEGGDANDGTEAVE